MRFKLQLVVESAGRCPVVTELLRIERNGMDAGNLGLHLQEARELLGQFQTHMVAAQVEDYVERAGQCPHCQRKLGCKGHHDIVYRTVFGTLRLDSPRLYHCPACHQKRTSFSPLAQCLTTRSSPELQYLQTKFAAPMSYGLTVDILSEVLPLDNTLAPTSVRRWAQQTAVRLEQSHREIDTDRNTVLNTQPTIPPRSPVKAIGIDGGYIRRAGVTHRNEGWFEVIVGKSQREDTSGGCYAYVHCLEHDPPKRMRRFLDHEGIKSRPVTFLSDGGDTVRQAQFGHQLFGEWLLDWFHIGVRFQHLVQLAKGLTEGAEGPTKQELIKDILRAKWHLWHGCAFRALQRLERMTWEIDIWEESPEKAKLAAKLDEAYTFFHRNQAFIVNYGDRYRHGEPIASSFVESAVNQVVSKRFVKKQQMAWSDRNAHHLLQVRTAVLNDELRKHFETWYPSMAANTGTIKKAA